VEVRYNPENNSIESIEAVKDEKILNRVINYVLKLKDQLNIN
jgi:hypothetical protein